MGALVVGARTSLPRQQFLQAPTGEKHDLFVYILKAAEKIAFKYAKVGYHKAFRNPIRFKKLHNFFKSSYNLCVVMADVDLDQAFGVGNILAVDILILIKLSSPALKFIQSLMCQYLASLLVVNLLIILAVNLLLSLGDKRFIGEGDSPFRV